MDFSKGFSFGGAYNDILRRIDQKKQVILVLLDLSAAFDTTYESAPRK